ncbi:MAG: hypothetical protein MZV64_23400 [Ignavibacteriales bacterium]|nr:hypothetical protein [Ignavibacteriales bacterium]
MKMEKLADALQPRRASRGDPAPAGGGACPAEHPRRATAKNQPCLPS